MNNLISTLVIEALDSDMTNQAGATATSIANAAATNRLAVQRDGAFAAGDATNTTADQLIKLSAATTMSDGSVSVMSTSEFKLGDIIASHYAVPSGGTAAIYSLNFTNAEKVGGMFFLRLERRDGLGINDSETFSGETLAKLVDAFKARKEFTEFDNVSLASGSATALTVTVAARDSQSDVHISTNDGVTKNDSNPTDKKGSLTVAKGLEKSGFISQGAYNQYGFPIVVPESSTSAGQDYGIYTIELRKKVGGRFVFETIKVLIADDEANAQKTALAINNLLGLTAADSTVPVVTNTVVSMVTDAAGETGAGTSYSEGGETEIFVKATNLEVGTTAILTINSDDTADAGHGLSQEFSVTAAAAQVFAITVVDAGDFAAGSVIKATLVLRDSSNNLSAGKVQATGITIQA